MGLKQERLHRVRTAAIGTAAVLALTLSACSSSEGSGSTGASIDIGNGTINPTDSKKVAFVSGGAETFAYIAAQVDGVKTAADEAGFEVDTYYANYDPAVELANIRQVMTSGQYAGVIYTPAGGPQACKMVAEEAVRNDVLVVMNAATLCGENEADPEANWSPGTVQFVGGASLIEGYEKCLASAAEVAPGPQKVLLVQGTETSPSSIGLKAAWDSFVEDHPDWELVEQVYTDFTAPTSFSTVQNALQSGADEATIIFNNYVEIAAGAVKAVEEQGLKGDIKVMDVGGGSEQDVAMLESGDLFATCPTYPFSMGEQSIETLQQALDGEQPDKVVLDDGQDEPLAMVTAEDVTDFDPQY